MEAIPLSDEVAAGGSTMKCVWEAIYETFAGNQQLLYIVGELAI